MNRELARTVRSQFAILPGGKHRTPQGDPRDSGRERKTALAWRSRLPLVTAFGVALVTLVLWIVTIQSGPAALRHLPVKERAALVQRTLSNLHDICRGGDRPRDFCKRAGEACSSTSPSATEACRAEAREELLADTAVK